MEYVPREQFVPFHKRKQRHSVLVTHRRCGKTVASICDLIGKAIKPPPARQGFEGGRFAYIATTYAAGKDIAWEMLKAYSRPFIAELPNESPHSSPHLCQCACKARRSHGRHRGATRAFRYAHDGKALRALVAKLCRRDRSCQRGVKRTRKE